MAGAGQGQSGTLLVLAAGAQIAVVCSVYPGLVTHTDTHIHTHAHTPMKAPTHAHGREQSNTSAQTHTNTHGHTCTHFFPTRSPDLSRLSLSLPSLALLADLATLQAKLHLQTLSPWEPAGTAFKCTPSGPVGPQVFGKLLYFLKAGQPHSLCHTLPLTWPLCHTHEWI